MPKGIISRLIVALHQHIADRSLVWRTGVILERNDTRRASSPSAPPAVTRIHLIRDREEMAYEDSIRDFMKRLGRGDSVIVVISKKYLESPNCMFELAEIEQQPQFRNRVFPILLPDANIYEAIARTRYVRHWEQKIEELDAALEQVKATDLHGLYDDINDYQRIRTVISRLMDVLRDMNAKTLEHHQKSAFGDLKKAIEARLAG
jgi:internalin A